MLQDSRLKRNTVAYSLIVLPNTIAWYLQFNHHHVPPAATFFATSMFHLSSAINVALFLIIRPELLLFPHPRELDAQEIQLTPQGTNAQGPALAIFSDRAKFQHSPEPTLDMQGDEGSMDNTTLFHINSRRISDDIKI